MRILIGPIEISGYYSNLARGFQSQGHACDFYTFKPHPFVYGGESKKSTILKLVNWCNKFLGKSKRPLLIRAIVALPREILTHIWGLYVIFKYDVFVFGFGESLFRGNKDLIVLRWLNKVVISNFAHGSEARPPYINGFLQTKEGLAQTAKQLCCLAASKKNRLLRFEKFANYIIGAPYSTTYFAQSRLINTFALGVPIDLSLIELKKYNAEGGWDGIQAKKVRILHSPSHAVAKGSELIKIAIENLRNRGLDIEFVLIQGKSFQDVTIEIQRCDFVVDQIYSDTPMAGFATEAAWFGKPAVVGGYGLEELRQYVPEGMWAPSKICHPNNIEKAIEDLILNKEKREILGREAQAFVHLKWSAEEVAKRYLRIIHDDIPEEWWLNPNDVCYLQGAGQSADRTIDNIRNLVNQYGICSLELSHRPDLEDAFLEFAGINKNQSQNAPFVS